MRTDDFDYALPEELIAQAPAEPRDSCRLMVVHRATGEIEDRVFSEIGRYFSRGDLLVANETRVRPARLVGEKARTGGAAETLLVHRHHEEGGGAQVWECLVKPGRRLKAGAVIEFWGADPKTGERKVLLTGTIEGFLANQRGGRLVRFQPEGGLTMAEAVNAVGTLPLPPYISGYHGDLELYQTVYATDIARSAAAPTAGLHFTPELIARLQERGIGWQTVELEVGLDTFRLVEEDDPTDHVMHTERYDVGVGCVAAIDAAHARGSRVVAVGTTAVRSLESAWSPEAGKVVPRHHATTDLFLLPGSEFHVVDAMITNFHVPRSTLMMLVSAFASRELIMRAYEHAVAERYRMLSFGDAMLIL